MKNRDNDRVFASDDLAPLNEIARLRAERDLLRERINRTGSILAEGVKVHGSLLGVRALEALKGTPEVARFCPYCTGKRAHDRYCPTNNTQ